MNTETINSIDEKMREDLVRKISLSFLTEESPLLLDANDIAYMLKCSYDYFIRNLASAPSFPAPVLLDRKGGKNQKRKWRASDIVRWQRTQPKPIY